MFKQYKNSGYIVFALLVCVCAAAQFQIRTYRFLSVQSDSMRPALRTGDLAIVDTSRQTAQVGNIVSFRNPIRPATINSHRVVSIDYRRGVMTTKGDNAAAADTVVPLRNIVGTVAWRVPALGYVVDALKHPVGLGILIYLPALRIIWLELRRLHPAYILPRRYVLYR